jgi:hypothetical protein
MPAAHVRHSPTAIETVWQLAELYPAARRSALRELCRLGQWGRGELDAQTVTCSLTWAKGVWVFKGGGGGESGDGEEET